MLVHNGWPFYVELALVVHLVGVVACNVPCPEEIFALLWRILPGVGLDVGPWAPLLVACLTGPGGPDPVECASQRLL
eukprot:2410797-Pyramimonas_sp.AAC.1